MATHNLAVIIKNPSDDGKFLLVKQTPPPKFGDEEYDSYVDSDLWDLPSTQLSSLEGESQTRIVVEGEESCLEKLDLSKFDLNLALNQILQQVGFGRPSGVQWKLWKCVEEPEFGPGLPIKTVYISGVLGPEHGDLQGQCKWMSFQSCLNCLLEVKPCSDRVGSLVVIGLVDDSIRSSQSKIPHALNFQEYPPGVKVVPMGSRTAKPFSTTNLVIFAPESGSDGSTDSGFISQGDALIVDPGCRSQFHEELKEIVAALPGKLVVFVTHHHHDHVDGKLLQKLKEIVAALPGKLVVFVTHHHHDHVDGLSVVQKSNPDAILLAHENTLARIQKDHWSLRRTPVLGGEEICIGGQRVKVIFAPGHTDGHMALLDVSTHSLIVGDHCVGQGSAVLDISSGGNMHDYFETTYKFLEISPHVLISMHGRLNMWPKHMLCAYLKNRRDRESTILKAIENGAKTLFDIVAYTYANVDCSLWIYAASNVRLHVDHLAHQDKLPKDFSLETFNSSIVEFAAKVGKF
ncbi:Endoribonuclease [Actinidia chinensis var. chinensis]|uniref:Endoribonuclease n=1 Tax=Actinidia chinensis var. chinensis TaxID=1590841 RepID=A0A2R6PH92_ACTCC|nr:Endoribonuclease [Actinidia chinensis var. chinensis]